MYVTVCPLCDPCLIPSHDGVFSRDLSLADRTLSTRPEPAWQKPAQSPLNGTTWPVDSEEEGRSSPMDR